MDPLVELLERQVDFLLRQASIDAFLVQVEPFLRALRSEPRLAAHLEDLRSELVDIVRQMETEDGRLAGELVELRKELVEARPETDDSEAEEFPPGADVHARLDAQLRYRGTLAYFDECVGSLVLVDLAPATEAGWKQKSKPVQIAAEEFFAAAPDDMRSA